MSEKIDAMFEAYKKGIELIEEFERCQKQLDLIDEDMRRIEMLRDETWVDLRNASRLAYEEWATIKEGERK